MDIVERLARQAAETINGGEFYDGKWYTEGQRQAWRKAMTPAADEIERLQKDVENAMDILLTKKQIKFIKSNTFSGPSKKQWVRKLVNMGIEEQIAEWEEE